MSRGCWVAGIVMGGLLLLVQQQARAAQAGDEQVQVRGQGVELTLQVPGGAYQRGSLIRVGVTVRNIAHQPLSIRRLSCPADGPSPEVQVLSRSGRIVFPPALSPPPLGDAQCAGGPPPPLAPGGALHQEYFVILDGPLIRALALPDGRPVETGVIRLRFTPGTGPRVAVTTSGQGIVARVAEGRVWYSEWYTCRTADGVVAQGTTFVETAGAGGPPSYYGQVMNWVHSNSGVLRVGCGGGRIPLEWHAVVGRLNHPVARIVYGSSCVR